MNKEGNRLKHTSPIKHITKVPSFGLDEICTATKTTHDSTTQVSSSPVLQDKFTRSFYHSTLKSFAKNSAPIGNADRTISTDSRTHGSCPK